MSQEILPSSAEQSARAAATEKTVSTDGPAERKANGSGALISSPFPLFSSSFCAFTVHPHLTGLIIAGLSGPNTELSTPSQGPPSTDDPRASGTRSTQEGENDASEAEPKKKRSFLSIPRSTSQSQQEDGTALSGATVGDSTESIGRGSKRSFIGRRRAGSTASSKRSQQRPATSEKTAAAPQTADPDQTDSSPTKVKAKKAGGGLLSCFGCFSGPKETHLHPVEEEPPENAKQASKVRPGRSTQATPVKKQDASAAESSTADSKEPMDEKTGEVYNAERRENEKPIHGDATIEKPSPPVPPTIITRSSSKKQAMEQPLPPLPQQNRLDTTSSPQVTVQAPTPVVSQEEEQIIHDRTPEQEQRDTDIEMTDASPSIPLSTNDTNTANEDGASQSSQRESVHGKVDLPPPPPLAERRDQTASSAAAPQSQETSLAVTPAEPQKWLLPPIRPEFKGKKCLVLDLDETLVHSSFKVRFVWYRSNITVY